MKPRDAFLRELSERAAQPKRLGNSHSLFELGDGQALVYVRYFSVKTGTAIKASKIPLRKWAIAVYLDVTSPKGLSSMQLHRDLGVTQKTAWLMLHRIREAWADDEGAPLTGPVEADAMYLGGRNKNKPVSQRHDIGAGPKGKQAVVGVVA